MTLLIFPCDNLITRLTLPVLLHSYDSIVLATSNRNFEEVAFSENVYYLPPVFDAAFSKSISKLISEKSVTEVFSPHPLVNEFLNKYREHLGLPPIIQLSAQSFLSQNFFHNVTLLNYIDKKLGAISLKDTEFCQLRAALLACENLYGQTSLEKLIEITKISRELPEGDIVEIGVFFGKSGFFLSEISYIFNLGKVLLVDSWHENYSIQNDKLGLLQSLSKKWNWTEVFETFLINMLPLTKNMNFSYLKEPSKKASVLYSNLREFTTHEFGKVTYSGFISLLHIDANHDYASVKADIETWTPKLIPGAWVLFDDYLWSAGNGVKLAVDEFLENQSDKIDFFYIVDKSLFLRMKD